MLNDNDSSKRKRKAAEKMTERFRILTVGDGDLTLSLALARAFQNNIFLVASTLVKTENELIDTYSNAKQVLLELEERNVPVRFGVDATNLNDSLRKKNDETHTQKFDAILFHHPHLGGSLDDEQAHAHRHYVLLAHYFYSAKQCLRQDGVVHVCLCGRQAETWRVVEAAQRQGLVLHNKVSTGAPIDAWLSLPNMAAEVLPHYPAPRRYRNGKLGSKHFLGKYGYRHRRTHGEQAAGRGAADVNVSGSFHFVFGMNDESVCSDYGEEQHQVSETQCRVCGMQFESVEELQKHCRAPALPDPIESETDTVVDCSSDGNEECNDDTASSHSMDDCEVKVDTAPANHAAGTSHCQRVDSTAVPLPIDDLNDIIYSTTVSNEYDGKRLRWYLRQCSYGKDNGLSKQQSHRMIKGGRVALNGTIVVDSARFLHCGDTVSVLKEPTTKDGANPPAEKVEIHHHADNAIVAFKPVGMRTIGSFSAETLEMTVSAQTGESFKAVSKLDTGCAGLCVLRREDAAVKNVSHVFVALVHGNVPDCWNGLSLPLPTESMRRWRKGGASNDIDGDTKVNDMASEKRPTDASIESLVEIEIVERTHALSTVKISTSSKAGGLCNAICFLLRKRGHPVVNDRFCRGEYLSLPRSVRNLIKKRLCIGCYQVTFLDESTRQVKIVAVDVPEKLHAMHWQNHFVANVEQAE